MKIIHKSFNRSRLSRQRTLEILKVPKVSLQRRTRSSSTGSKWQSSWRDFYVLWQDWKATEEKVPYRRPDLAAHNCVGFREAEVPWAAGAEGLGHHDQEGRAAAQDAKEDALQDQVVVARTWKQAEKLKSHLTLLYPANNKRTPQYQWTKLEFTEVSEEFGILRF